MKKQITAISLVAGTCIGSGMLALPIVLASVGIIPSIFIMLITCFFMYFTALINVELNLRAGEGLALGALARRFSGHGAEILGTICFKLLSYSLLCVYIYGGSSIFQKLLVSYGMMESCDFTCVATIFSVVSALCLMLPMNILGQINSFLFILLLAVVAVLLIGLLYFTNWTEIPLLSERYQEFSVWHALLPVVFTSFGFQVIFHTITNLCNKDKDRLKSAFFWGCLIPALVYLVWTSGVLIVVNHGNPDFYRQMVNGQVEVGDLIQQLSAIAKWPAVQALVWWISLLAIATSVLGVGVGLFDAYRRVLPQNLGGSLFSAVITILPAYIITLWIPNAFIVALGFAGMILAVIAILLPIYLFYLSSNGQLIYPELRHNWLIVLSLIFGLVIIGSEILNMIMRNH